MPMITLSPATRGDVDAMAALLEEMDRFYGATSVEPLDQRVRQISVALFSKPPAAQALLARDGSELVGIASYSFLWPAVGLTRSLYLKELYVAEAYRRQGVGKLLMRSLIGVATESGCSRIEWTTDTGNVEAQVFYDKLGVPALPSKLFYRVEDVGGGLQLHN